jgi:hypothetical protein
MTILKKLFFCASSIFLLNSCAMLYQPNVANVPLHQQKGDSRVSAHIGVLGANFQASYAINDYLFANLNANIFRSKEDSSADFTNHSLGGLAIGYYKPLGEDEVAVFECSAGWSYAGVEDRESSSSTPIWAKTNYHKIYIQPSIGATTNYFDGAFSMRLVALQYVNFENMITAEQFEVYPGMIAFVEPLITVRAGYDPIKLSLQAGYNIPLSPEHELGAQTFFFLPTINIGIQANFNLMKKDVKDENIY